VGQCLRIAGRRSISSGLAVRLFVACCGAFPDRYLPRFVIFLQSERIQKDEKTDCMCACDGRAAQRRGADDRCG